MKILFLPNFSVHRIPENTPSLLPANKHVRGKGYWFLEHFPSADVVVIDNASVFPFTLSRKLARVETQQAIKAILCQRDYDIIISHSFNSALVFGLLRSTLSVDLPPHFVIDVGCLNGGIDNPLQIPIIRHALKSVHGLIYHSSINETFYSKHFPGVKRAFVPFGTDPDIFRPLSQVRSDDYALSIGYGARDYETLIRAWKDVDFPLVIVGTTKLDTQSLKNVRLVPMVPIDELVRLIHNARFVVLPIERLRYSVGQTTLTQCMSMEKAIIVNRVPGTVDYIRDGENCLAVEYGNVEELQAKIGLLLHDPRTAGRMSTNARKDVIENLNEKRMAGMMYEFIKSHID
jgi:glycosyltransferase involved in cell wall biosynthesis